MRCLRYGSVAAHCLWQQQEHDTTCWSWQFAGAFHHVQEVCYVLACVITEIQQHSWVKSVCAYPRCLIAGVAGWSATVLPLTYVTLPLSMVLCCFPELILSTCRCSFHPSFFFSDLCSGRASFLNSLILCVPPLPLLSVRQFVQPSSSRFLHLR